MMSYLLTLRVKELALRKVLGASEGKIIRLILWELLSIAGIGIGLGLLLAPALLRPILPFLFEVTLVDMFTYLLVVGILVVLSLLAAVTPSWKALYINPVTVLRRD